MPTISFCPSTEGESALETKVWLIQLIVVISPPETVGRLVACIFGMQEESPGNTEHSTS